MSARMRRFFLLRLVALMFGIYLGPPVPNAKERVLLVPVMPTCNAGVVVELGYVVEPPKASLLRDLFGIRDPEDRSRCPKCGRYGQVWRLPWSVPSLERIGRYGHDYVARCCSIMWGEYAEDSPRR